MRTLLKIFLCVILASVIILLVIIRNAYTSRKGLMSQAHVERSITNSTGLATSTSQTFLNHQLGNQDDTKILFSPALNPALLFLSKTDLKTWGFKTLVDCPLFNINDTGKERKNLKFSCEKEGPFISYEVTSSINVSSFPFGNSCVSDIIDKYCNDGKPVPNVLHYVWFGKVEVKFHHFLSFMSAVRYMKPCLIIYHGEHLPYGKYWDYFTSKYYKIIHLTRPLVTHVYGQKLSWREHGSDVMRIEAVQKYGGLYIDSDSLILRELDELRNYNCTMGMEYGSAFGNQFIMATRGAKFIDLYHNGYRNYKVGDWFHNSMYIPHQIALKHPDLIHVEHKKFWRPEIKNVWHILTGNYNWTINYAMHLVIRFYTAKTDEFIIRKLNNTYGSLGRHVLYGNKELCL